MITKKTTAYTKPKYAIAMASVLMLGTSACTRVEDRGALGNTAPDLDGDIAVVEETTKAAAKTEEVKLMGEVPVVVSTECESQIPEETLTIVGEVAVEITDESTEDETMLITDGMPPMPTEDTETLDVPEDAELIIQGMVNVNTEVEE